MKLVLANTQSSQSHLPPLNGDGYEYPSDLVDPEIKNTKEYCLKYLKAGYYAHYNNQCLINNTVRTEWIEKRAYADGNQSNIKYAQRISKLRDAQNQVVSYQDLDQRLLKTIPEFIDIIFSNLDKIDYDVYCDAIHPEAHDERKEMKWGLWTTAQLQPFFQEMEAKAKVQLTGNQEQQAMLPKTMHELELMMQYSVRLNEEMEMELGQQMVLYENDFKETKKQLLLDGIKLGVMFSSVEIDRISGRVRVNYEDPINGIFEDFHGQKGKMQRRGVFRKMTIAQAMLKYGNQFTREDYFQIAKSACGRWGNPESINEQYVNTDAMFDRNKSSSFYDSWQNNIIYVMDYEWDTCDTIKTERMTVYGNTMTFRRGFNESVGKKSYVGKDGSMYEREVFATDVKTIYGGEWIVGTDYIANWGKRVNIPRPNENPKECYGKFRFYRIGNTSMLDRMLPYIDAMQLKWLRIQNCVARAIPSGFIIKQDALIGVILDNKEMSQQALMEMLFQTGILVVNNSTTLDDDNPNVSTKPIERFDAGFGSELTELYNSMIRDREALKADTGINDFLNSATPNPNALVGVAEMAVVNAQNAIYPILSGFIAHHEDICTGITLNLQLLTRYKQSLVGYVPSLGLQGTKLVEITSNIDKTIYGTPVMFGTRISARATQDQKQRMLNYIDATLANSQSPDGGGLEITDAIELSRLINNGTNLKLVAAILADRITKHKNRVQQEKLQLVDQQNKSIIEQTKAASETAAEADKRKIAMEKELYTHKTNEDIRKIVAEYQQRNSNDVVKGKVKEGVEAAKEEKAITT